MDSLTDNLQDFYDSPSAVKAVNIHPGATVVAKFSEDEVWYRGQVKSVSDISAQVEFIDYGNCDTVTVDSLQKVDKQFFSIPTQAVHCSLFGVRPLSQGNTWSGDAKEFLERLTENGALCKFLGSKGGTFEVDLEVDGKSIAKEMISLAVVRGMSPDASAAPPKFQQYRVVQTNIGQSYLACVAYVDSVDSFHVQLTEGVGKLEDLMSELQDHYRAGSRKPVSEIVVSGIFISVFSFYKYNPFVCFLITIRRLPR